MATQHTPVVMVGVDGSEGSAAALDFAIQEALARDAVLEVVTAWMWSPLFEQVEHVVTAEEGHARAARLQDELLEAATARTAELPPIARRVLHDYAGKALVSAADRATMLVVGSARKGTVARAVMGSVSEYCVRHSPAPVVVVPAPGRVDHPARLQPATVPLSRR